MLEPKKNTPLSQLLLDRLPPEDVEYVSRVLWSYFDLGRNAFPLVSASDLDEEDICRTIALATSRDVSGIDFLPARRLPWPLWMSSAIGDALTGAWGTELLIAGGQEVLDGLFHNPMGSILHAIAATFDGEHIDSFRALIYDGIRSSLAIFIQLLMHGRREDAAKLEPLILLFPRCVPLGESRDRAATWFAVVAGTTM